MTRKNIVHALALYQASAESFSQASKGRAKPLIARGYRFTGVVVPAGMKRRSQYVANRMQMLAKAGFTRLVLAGDQVVGK